MKVNQIALILWALPEFVFCQNIYQSKTICEYADR